MRKKNCFLVTEPGRSITTERKKAHTCRDGFCTTPSRFHRLKWPCLCTPASPWRIVHWLRAVKAVLSILLFASSSLASLVQSSCRLSLGLMAAKQTQAETPPRPAASLYSQSSRILRAHLQSFKFGLSPQGLNQNEKDSVAPSTAQPLVLSFCGRFRCPLVP